jgi:hypothetical protein
MIVASFGQYLVISGPDHELPLSDPPSPVTAVSLVPAVVPSRRTALAERHERPF